MSIKSAITTLLKGHAGLTALISGRVYWMKRPEGSLLPAVTFRVISDVPENTVKSGSGSVKKARVQIDCWAADGAVNSVASQVEAAMKTATFQNIQLTSFDDYEDETSIYRVSMDYSTW